MDDNTKTGTSIVKAMLIVFITAIVLLVISALGRNSPESIIFLRVIL